MYVISSGELVQLIEQSSFTREDKNLFISCLNRFDNSSNGPEEVQDVFKCVLERVSQPQGPSSIPLEFLSYVLSNFPEKATVLQLLKFYYRAVRLLPESAISQTKNELSILQSRTASGLKKSYGNFKSLIWSSVTRPALIDASSGTELSHKGLSDFLQTFILPIDASKKPIVAIALANGSLLGLALLSVVTYYTAAPINTSGGQEQFRSDIQLVQAKYILTTRGDIDRLGLRQQWLSDAGIKIFLLDQRPDDLTFTVEATDPFQDGQNTPARPNEPDDVALILFTSGTSGTKKMVPVTLHTIVSGACCVVESWGLTEKDICLNMMPLNHVGGIVRNLFSPILSGGATILCTAFDPSLFWDLTGNRGATWYYASPSMHMSILAERINQSGALSRHSIRLVCNAAGGLLPSLAIEIRDTFNCLVLPSYGMTECMPISTPPLDYALDRKGTSGKPCGPQIAILSNTKEALPAFQVGRINVRCGPTFTGYLTAKNEIDTSCFDENGYFDTGDMGYLDDDGFLFITGRSKEVINRGGELVSPLEVEEAILAASRSPDSPIYQRVQEVLAFSAPHELLQEVVAVALVIPKAQRRPDLRQIQLALKTSLHSSKWPVALVYIDDLPKGNNKLLRIGLGERLDFSPLNDAMVLSQRHFEATCPPPNTPLQQKIPKNICLIDGQLVSDTIRENLNDDVDVFVGKHQHDGFPEVILAPSKESTFELEESYLISTLQMALKSILDGYLLPSAYVFLNLPIPLHESGEVDEALLAERVHVKKLASANSLSATEEAVREIFAEILACPADDIFSDSDFFDLGGDSLSAGRFLSTLRRRMGVSVPVDKFFNASRVYDVGIAIDAVSASKSESSSQTCNEQQPLPGCEKTYSSTNPVLLAIHLLPICLFYPMKAAFRWIILIYSLSILSEYWTNSNIAARFLSLIVSIAMSRVATYIVSPFFGAAMKWIIVGRYREGMYPMWGPYHTRWWLVQKILVIYGKGIFSYFDTTRVWYYRMLGAKIGKGVKIQPGTILGEYDLLDIGDNVTLDPCICRPFAAERNTSMYLGKITLGNNSSVGLKACVAPGSVVPEGHCIGANSSSHEMDEDKSEDTHLSRSQAPKTHPLVYAFAIMPIKVVVIFLAALPWMGGLFGIVKDQPAISSDNLKSVLLWWASAGRVAFHYLAGQLNTTIRPFVWFALVVLIKKLTDRFIGKTKPGPLTEMSAMARFRASLIAALIPQGSVHHFSSFFGTHYEISSMIARALGAKVGNRVYWPGTGPSIQSYDLLEVGDDVVFGSRSHIITTDGQGNARVKIGNRSMVADRVVILPGTQLGERVVLGSGAITERNKEYPTGSVWIGNHGGKSLCLSGSDKASSIGSGKTLKEQVSLNFDEKPFKSIEHTPSASSTASTKNGDLEKGSLPPLEKSTSSPFGKAFYEGRANYRVIGQFGISLYSITITAFTQAYWDAPTICMIQCLAYLARHRPEVFEIYWYRPILIFALSVGVESFFCSALSLLALGIVIAAKWILLGRRKVGNYDWDKSSYCQRWQIFLTIEMIRRRCYGGYGIIAMLSGTHYAVMYFRALGATIGKDCALFAGGRPSLAFTEPDLLELGDRVAIDDASLVSHINSRGNFSLNFLQVGSRSVLRSGSRLLSGAQMGEDSCLLEHTLIMAGDFADEKTTYQGWPADVFTRPRVPLSTDVANLKSSIPIDV